MGSFYSVYTPIILSSENFKVLLVRVKSEQNTFNNAIKRSKSIYRSAIYYLFMC